MVTFATSYYSETHATHLFWCKYGRARTRQQKTILLHRLTEQAQGSADKERHVTELYDWTKLQGDAAPCWMSSPGFMESCSSSGQTSVCDARMLIDTTRVRLSLGWRQARAKRREHNVMVRSSTRWIVSLAADSDLQASKFWATW